MPAIAALESRLLLSATCAVDHDHDHDHDYVHDHELYDADGREYHALALPDTALTPENTGDFDGAGTLADLAATFQLHSNPNASHTIYLDFDGAVTSGTSWNSSFNGGADIVTPAFDFEGGTSVFTDNELTRIQYIWQRVAEDFLPFDVNVTTQDPGAAALSKSGSGDTEWGVRVVIGGNGDWYGSAGGVAYVGSFDWSSDTPVFAFSDNLLDSEKYVAEAVSHEAGHALHLSHDGGASTSYYQGHGSGATSWAPIMGNSYYKDLTQWSRGEYTGANNTQDDLAIITGQNGFGYRADDYGDTIATAGQLDVSATSAGGSGIIETSDDRDVFGFVTGAGTISFDVSAVYRGPNLDILVELYDATGNLIVSANPADQLSASFSVSVNAGAYYLLIDGVGQGDPLADGYTDYGSLGGYRIDGTIVESDGTLPSTYSIGAQSADQTEGDSGTTAFTFVVTRSGDVGSAGTVDYVVSGSGANPADASDFNSGFDSGTVSFAAGETSKTITLYVTGDQQIETDEEFIVTLSNPSNDGQLGTSTAAGHIRNDDIPGFIVTPTSGLTVNESGATATFSVVLTHPPTADVHVAVTTTDASEGTVDTNELVFTVSNWDQPQTVTVTGVDDAENDGNQSFAISLGAASSNDPGYDGLDPQDVQVTNHDNDKGNGKGGGKGGGGGGGGGKKGPKKAPLINRGEARIEHSPRSATGDAGVFIQTAFTSEETAATQSPTDAFQVTGDGHVVTVTPTSDSPAADRLEFELRDEDDVTTRFERDDADFDALFEHVLNDDATLLWV